MVGTEKGRVTPEVLQGLLGSIGDGVILTDQDERITFINPAAMRILGCEGENVRGMECMDVCRFIRIGSNRPYKDPLKKAMEGRSSVGLSRNVGIYRGNEPVYLSATCSPIVHIDGRVTGCSVILRDVSRMRRLARKIQRDHAYMRSVFTAAKVGLCVLDSDAAISDMNESAVEILDRARQESVGMQFGDAFRCENSFISGCGHGHLCPRCPVRHNLETALADETYASEFTVTMHRFDDPEPVWLHIFLSQAVDEGARQIILALIDVSARKQREQALEEARERAEAASHAKGEFLANMSHEIRTPINGMNGMIDLALRTELTDEQKEFLTNAKQCSSDLLRIVSDILDFAKLDSGHMQLENIGFDLHETLEGVCTLYAKMAEHKGLTFTPPDLSNLPQFVVGDALRLRQILNNLLNNAMKFTKKGGVSVKATPGEQGSMHTLEITVRDTGIGIPEHAQKKLFQPFQQVDGSTTRRFGGTGLGLAIVKELVHRMGGSIDLYSIPDRGSAFSFWIPLVEAEGAETPAGRQTVFLAPTHAAAPQPQAEKSPPDVSDIDDLLAYCEQKLEGDGNPAANDKK